MSDYTYAWAIPVWNGRRFVETLHSIPKDDRVLVIDNSITGWALAKSWNYAVERLCGDEGYDVCILANDDIVVKPDTGALLTEALMELQYSEIEARPCNQAKLLAVSGYNIRDIDRPQGGPPRNLPTDLHKFEPRWAQGPDFSCIATNLELLNTVGLFDENFIGAYHEDNDQHRRIQLGGFEALSFAPYWHWGSTTLHTSDAPDRTRINENYLKNERYYISKWGGKPHHETFVTEFNR